MERTFFGSSIDASRRRRATVVTASAARFTAVGRCKASSTMALAHTATDLSNTTSTYYLRQGGVCIVRRLSVCPSVCLLATLRKNYWMDLCENLITDGTYFLDWFNFESYRLPDSHPGIFKKNSSTLRDETFSTQFGSYFWKNWLGFRTNDSTNVILDEKVSVNNKFTLLIFVIIFLTVNKFE